MRIFIYECVCAGGLGADVSPSLRSEGWAMLSAIANDFGRIPGVEVETLLEDAFPHRLAQRCTRTTTADELAHFQFLAAECDWTLVVAPEFDDLLLARSKLVLKVGGKLLGSLPEAIELTGDKWATARFWADRGVAHPATSVLDCSAFPEFDPPWVLKPRQGAGSQATFLVRNREEMENRVEASFQEWPNRNFIVQKFVSGMAASLALLIGPTEVVALIPSIQHLSVDGRFRYLGGSLPLPGELANRATSLAQRSVANIPGLQGYVGVDLVLGNRGDGRDDYAIEINPRLTTSYIGLRRLCKQNLAHTMLRCVRGMEIDNVSWRAEQIDFRPEEP